MRLVLTLSAPFAIAATTPIPAQPPETTKQELSENCSGRIERIREERDLPKIENETTLPGEPLMLAAVDQRIDGCAVMMMHGNTSDVRPLPEFREGPAQRMPAAGGH